MLHWRFSNISRKASANLKIHSIQRRIEIYETRYRKISELFIYQYSSIFIYNIHISKLFRYINPCTSMQFHGRLVRNWCGGFEMWHTRKWVHHDITFQNKKPCNNVICTLLQGYYVASNNKSRCARVGRALDLGDLLYLFDGSPCRANTNPALCEEVK